MVPEQSHTTTLELIQTSASSKTPAFSLESIIKRYLKETMPKKKENQLPQNEVDRLVREYAYRGADLKYLREF